MSMLCFTAYWTGPRGHLFPWSTTVWSALDLMYAHTKAHTWIYLYTFSSTIRLWLNRSFLSSINPFLSGFVWVFSLRSVCRSAGLVMNAQTRTCSYIKGLSHGNTDYFTVCVDTRHNKNCFPKDKLQMTKPSNLERKTRALRALGTGRMVSVQRELRRLGRTPARRG